MKDSRNIYKTAREAAGMTQERAAELLYSSPESLRAYETGKRIPPDDIVVRMIEVYGGCQYLAYQHLKTTAAAAACLPEVERKPLAVAAMSLLKELHDVEAKKAVIIEITSDGSVGDDQTADWGKVLKELRELCAAALTLTFADGADGKE